MKRIQHNHTVSGVFVFLLLGIFAVSATVMVLLGAQAYNGTTQRSADHNAERLSTAYVRGRLREADENGLLTVAAGDDSALKIYNDEEGTATVLYVYDGMLYEWYTLKSLAQQFDPSENVLHNETEQAGTGGNPEGSAAVVVQTARGESVCPLDEMRISAEGNLIKVNLRNGQDWTEVDYCIRTATDNQR